MKTRQANQTKQGLSRTEVNPAWVAFFTEAIRLAELARQRRAAAEKEDANKTDVKT